jgi:hypothetical protein
MNVGDLAMERVEGAADITARMVAKARPMYPNAATDLEAVALLCSNTERHVADEQAHARSNGFRPFRDAS